MEVLRRVLLQNYTRTVTGNGREVIRRREKEPEGDGLPPGQMRIASPYDTDARWGVKRDVLLAGLQAGRLRDLRRCPALRLLAAWPLAAAMTGTARGATFPNLITNAATTDATVPDIQMTGVIHGELAGRDLAPGRHYLDSGYLSAAVVVAALTTRGIALIGPLLADTSAQARAGHGYARADFAVDYDSRTVTCPQGKTSSSWTPCTQRGQAAAVATFAISDCGPCPARAQCTTSGKRLNM